MRTQKPLDYTYIVSKIEKGRVALYYCFQEVVCIYFSKHLVTLPLRMGPYNTRLLPA